MSVINYAGQPAFDDLLKWLAEHWPDHFELLDKRYENTLPHLVYHFSDLEGSMQVMLSKAYPVSWRFLRSQGESAKGAYEMAIEEEKGKQMYVFSDYSYGEIIEEEINTINQAVENKGLQSLELCFIRSVELKFKAAWFRNSKDLTFDNDILVPLPPTFHDLIQGNLYKVDEVDQNLAGMKELLKSISPTDSDPEKMMMGG